MEKSTLVAGIGQAGSSIAAEIWSQICGEHEIDITSGRAVGGAKGNWEKFFTRVAPGSEAKFVPRALFVDSDSRSSEKIRRSLPELFNPANFVHGDASSGNNFAEAFHEVGEKLSPKIREILYREGRKAPGISHLIVVHGLGGGSGAGLSALLFETFKEVIPNAKIISVGILPSESVSASVIEPYNAVFGMEATIKHASLSFIFKNEILLKSAEGQWAVKAPNLEDANRIVGKIICAWTSATRFNNVDNHPVPLDELISDSAPHPDFPIVTGTIFPIDFISGKEAHRKTAGRMLKQVILKNLQLSPCSEGTLLSLSIFHSCRADEEVFEKGEIQDEIDSKVSRFASANFDAEPSQLSSVCILLNSSSLGGWLASLCQSFNQLWSRRAFANWFLSAGMTETDIESRFRNVRFRAERYEDL